MIYNIILSIDFKIFLEFKKIRKLDSKCDNCPMRPACMGMENCPDHINRCDEFDKKQKINHAEERMIITYNNYKQNNSNL